MDQIHQRLVRRAHLFDDAAAYEAGVRDALDAVAAGGWGDDGVRHLAGAMSADAAARVADAKRVHPAGGRRGLRAVGDPAG